MRNSAHAAKTAIRPLFWTRPAAPGQRIGSSIGHHGMIASKTDDPAQFCKVLLSLICLVLTLAVLSGTVAAQTSGLLSDEALIEALRRGGYNLYFRHTATEWSQTDTSDKEGDWTSCDPDKVRQLSDKGRRDSRAMGKAIRDLRIQIGRIYSSPYCRTVETAQLMGLGQVETTHDLMNLRSAKYAGGRSAITKRARARLAQAPSSGTNNIFVAHGNLAHAATQIVPGEGESLIFQPLGEDGFRIVGRLTPEKCVQLAEQLG